LWLACSWSWQYQDPKTTATLGHLRQVYRFGFVLLVTLFVWALPPCSISPRVKEAFCGWSGCFPQTPTTFRPYVFGSPDYTHTFLVFEASPFWGNFCSRPTPLFFPVSSEFHFSVGFLKTRHPTFLPLTRLRILFSTLEVLTLRFPESLGSCSQTANCSPVESRTPTFVFYVCFFRPC